MLLHPEHYTEEQLDQMLDETNAPIPDVEEEWRHFKAKRHQRQHQNPMMRWAAVIITVATLSGISYAAIQHFWKANDDKDKPAATSQQPVVQETENSRSRNSRNRLLHNVDFPEPLGPETIRIIPYRSAAISRLLS